MGIPVPGFRLCIGFSVQFKADDKGENQVDCLDFKQSIPRQQLSRYDIAQVSIARLNAVAPSVATKKNARTVRGYQHKRRLI